MLGLEIFEIVIMLVGTLLVIVWIVFFLKGAQYRSMFSVLSEKEFPLKDIYGTGYAFLHSIGYKYKSKGDRKLRQELNVLYGEKYAEYYLHVTHAQQVTFTMTLFVLSFIFYGLARDLMIMFVFFMFSGLAYYYYGTQASKRIQARSDELLHDFADVVSKLALLTNAGMISEKRGREWRSEAKASSTMKCKSPLKRYETAWRRSTLSITSVGDVSFRR